MTAPNRNTHSGPAEFKTTTAGAAATAPAVAAMRAMRALTTTRWARSSTSTGMSEFRDTANILASTMMTNAWG